MKKTLIALSGLFVSAGAFFAPPPAPAAEKAAPSVSAEGIAFVENLSRVLEDGTLSDALALFDAMPESQKDDAGLLSLKASLLFSAGHLDEAEKIASALLAKNPKDVESLGLSALIAKQRNDQAKMNQHLKQIIAIDPKNADANIELGNAEALKRNYRNARDYYHTALQSEPENEEALFGYGKMVYFLGKNDKEAKEVFEKLISMNPGNAQAYSYRGKLDSENREYRSAKEYALKALALEPENSDFYFDLGTYCRYLGDFAGAEEAWTKAKDLDPEYFLGYAYLAGLYDEQDRAGEALENYRKVVEKNPRYYYAYESLGILAWHGKNYGEAKGAFEEARKKNADNVSYTLMIAACYMKENDYKGCKAFTEQAMKGMDRTSTEYLLVRLYHDQAGEASLAQKIQNETNKTKKGKYLYYYALYYDLKGKYDLAQKYYTEITDMKSPLFFEYRLAQWEVEPS